MAATLIETEKKIGVICERCGGKMVFEKFYGVNDAFSGWHCVICGDIVDEVILLHRLSRDANLKIPQEEQGVMHLLEKYLHTKELKGREKDKKGELKHPPKVKMSMN